jgi:hypothetical protein
MPCHTDGTIPIEVSSSHERHVPYIRPDSSTDFGYGVGLLPVTAARCLGCVSMALLAEGEVTSRAQQCLLKLTLSNQNT